MLCFNSATGVLDVLSSNVQNIKKCDLKKLKKDVLLRKCEELIKIYEETISVLSNNKEDDKNDQLEDEKSIQIEDKKSIQIEDKKSIQFDNKKNDASNNKNVQNEVNKNYGIGIKNNVRIRDESRKPTFAEITKSKHLKVQEKIEKIIELKSDQKERIIKNVLLIKSEENESLVKESLSKIKIKSYKKLKETITIVCADEQNASCALKELKERNVEAIIKEKKSPRMILKNVFNMTSDQDVLSEISVKNSIPENEISLITTFNKNEVSRNIVIEVKPNIRKRIIENGNKLYIGYQVCRVQDYIHVIQCFHCQKYGHKVENCPNKTEAVICMYCMNNHRSSACPNKLQKEKHKCSNCKECHPSNSHKCIKYIQHLSKSLSYINYDLN